MRPSRGLGALLAFALSAGPALAQREPVLGQVALPHPYYWREMYVPQVTSGPSGVTWSPDGSELIYSMQGSLWRQRITSDTAVELTTGPGYDYQPDWSPNGRFVAFARYAGDAIELELLDLQAGVTRPLTANRAVNVEPRWSPDGSRIAFVSSSYHARWHIFTLSIADGVPGELSRLTEDHDSELPRYYYSRWDHYISPTWSPDGRELLFVSNRGHIHGTGGFWRMAATPGAAMREVRYEETTWKARPDWSPDGRRVVYSSYLGRQWHQLWLMTSDGGDVFPLTYGDFDATAPRWSPDAGHIAYISNAEGNTALWVLDLPGARRRPVAPVVRRYREPMGQLRIVVRNRAGHPLAARVSVARLDGRSLAPDDAWRHADEAFDRTGRGFEYGYFHTPGRSVLTVPAESLTIAVWHGPEYRPVETRLAVRAGTSVTARFVLERIADLPALGWWSGDLHVHMNYGGVYRNTPPQLAFQARAEDLHVVEGLVVNKEQRIPDIAYFKTSADDASTKGFLLMYGQEYHTSSWGHLGLLGLSDHYLLPEYVDYPNTASASLYPMNADVADLAHAQGALVGYVHPFETTPDPSDTTQPLAYELPADVALGKVDYIEVMGYSDHLVTSAVWYRLLNCGFRLPAGAGTDAFPNFASLRGPPGLVRAFVKTGPSLDHARWLAGIKAGRTFVTNAPLLDFTLGGRAIGDSIRLPARGGELMAQVRVRSGVALEHVEIVGNGQVVARLALAPGGTSANATIPIPVTRSGWFVVRAYGDRARLPVLDLYPFGSTSPIYVQVGEEPVRSREDAEFFVRWIDRLAEDVPQHAVWNGEGERASVLARLAAARAVYVDRSLSAATPRSPASP